MYPSCLFLLQTIQHIIRRDFFPHVPKLKAKLEHLKSSAGSSTVDLNEVSARYASQQPTPSSSKSLPPNYCGGMCIQWNQF